MRPSLARPYPLAGLCLTLCSFLLACPPGVNPGGSDGGAIAPGAPTQVTAVAGAQQAQVQWTAPVDAGTAPIVSYKVVPVQGGTDGTALSVPAPATQATVPGLPNATTYQFKVAAVSAAGQGTFSALSASITTPDVPGAPTNVLATPAEASAQVFWTPAPSNGAPLVHSTVTASPGGASAQVSGTDTQATVSGLTDGVSYTFSVVSTNAVGDGPPATSNSIVPGIPPGAPTGVSATAGIRQAMVSWTAPVSNGSSSLNGFVVTPFSNGQAGTPSTILNGSATSKLMTGLANGTTYTFTVAALNAVGTGPQSAASSPVTTFDVPSAPTGVSATGGNGQATVSWTAPTTHGGSVLTGFIVTPFVGVTAGTPATVTDPLATQAVIMGLVNGTTYTFTVVATNAVGSSVASSPSANTTPAVPATVPGPPTGVAVTPGNGRVTVTWNAPGSNGGAAITGYTVTSTPGAFVQTVSSSTTPSIMTDLLNGTSYTFDVVANNTVGSSTAATSSAAVPVTVPGIPKDVVATRGNVSASLSFTPPVDTGGSAITGYVATTTSGGLSGTASAGATSVTVTGLTNGSNYMFTVQAKNAQGSSIASSNSNGISPGSNPVMKSQPPTSVGGYAGNGSANVYWTAPTNNGGSLVTSYTVTSSPGAFTATSTAPVTWAQVTGLTNSMSYTFTVTAHNSIGDSPASTASSAIVPSASGTACSLQANTTATGSVNNGCAMLNRDTSACAAARTGLGLGGFWLKFSCRVTLSLATVNAGPGVMLSTDSQPDYLSAYFVTTNSCHSYYSRAFPDPTNISASAITMSVPITPSGTGQTMPGMIGIALNGVSLFANVAAPGDDIYLESGSFDECQGHPNTTAYHYHTEPISISYDDDAFIGVMIDGYPLYGRRDPDGSVPTLDTNGGHTGVTVDSPSTPVYHYHTNPQISSTTGSAGTLDWFLSTGHTAAQPGSCTGCM